MRISFLTRAGCHLCEDAADVLSALQDRYRLDIVTVDIDADDDLVRDYGLQVPVVLGPDGSVLAEGVVTEAKLMGAFAALRP